MVRPRGRNVRLQDAVTYFLGQWPIESQSAATVRTYGRQLIWLVQFATSIDKSLLSDLTPELLRAAMAAKMDKSRRTSPTFKGGEAAARSVVMATRFMARWLLAQGVPVADLESVRARRPPERVQRRVKPSEFQALEQTILRRMVDADGRAPQVSIARDLALIYLLADTGLRISEVVSMTLDSVDFEQGSIIIDGKGNKQRALSIVDAHDPRGGLTLKLLGNWIEARATLRGTDQHAALWTSMRGRPLSVAVLRTTVLARLCKQAGLSGNRPPHTFRRMNFTESYLADPHLIEVLAQRMGWSYKSRQMIDVYTRGAKVDLARSTPIPSVGIRMRDSPIGPSRSGGSMPIPIRGAGPPNGTANGGPAPRLERKEAGPTASLSPRRRFGTT